MKVGVLGAGQLGRMLAEAGATLGMTFRFYDPADGVPVRGLGEHLRAEWDEAAALDRFADSLDLATYEFENVPLATAQHLAERLPLHPATEALRIAQDRLYEKNLFRELGVPVAGFCPLESEAEFHEALVEVGTPAVLKTRRLGYDGKGQRLIRTREDAAPAFMALRGVPLILEEFVPFRREVSVLAVRAHDGGFAAWPLVENHHRESILRLSLAPAPGEIAALQEQAEHCARLVMERLGYVGVLAIEFFEKDDCLYVNEMAPRVHNSGHWSIEGAETSQFENHLRAIAGLPLGATNVRGCSAMINLIGTIPPLEEVEKFPGAFVHLYGKSPRPGRKIGHVTMVADNRERLAAMMSMAGYSDRFRSFNDQS